MPRSADHPDPVRKPPEHPAASTLENRPLFFLHIQKTAGKSAGNLLANRFPLQAVLQLTQPSLRPQPGLDAFQFISGHCSYGYLTRFSRRPVVLTFLREPLDRAFSAYYYFRRDTQATLDAIRTGFPAAWADERVRFTERSRDLPLLEFLEREPALARTRLANMQTRALLHTADLWEETNMPEDAMLREAMNNLRACELVGLTERMPESLSLIEHRLHWQGLGPMPRHNENPHRKKTSEADPKAVEILTTWNRLDLELYRFAQSLFEERLAAMRRESPGEITAVAPQLPDAVAFNVEQAIHGRGWEPRESQGGEWFAWMGAEKEAWIDLGIQTRGPHHFRCRIAHSIRPSVLDGLRISVNGNPLDLRMRREKPAYVVEADLPADALAQVPGRARITFTVAETARPCDLDPALSDTRSLGIAVSSISLIPPS